MSRLVIDASIVIAWAVPDEIDDGADIAMRQAQVEGAVVPALWFLEIANVLLMNERKDRLTRDEVTGILEDLMELPLVVDRETPSRAFADTMALARRHALTVYDAAYLELARRRDLPLATLDRELAEACRAEGLEVVGASS